MKRKGVSSSLALLASIVILMTQICINLAFMEVMSEEIANKAREFREFVESRDYSQMMLIAVNETTLMVVNRRSGDVLINGLSLCYLNGSTTDVKVEWYVPKMSTSEHHVPQSLRDCIAVILDVGGATEVMLPVYRAAMTLSGS